MPTSQSLAQLEAMLFDCIPSAGTRVYVISSPINRSGAHLIGLFTKATAVAPPTNISLAVASLFGCRFSGAHNAIEAPGSPEDFAQVVISALSCWLFQDPLALEMKILASN